MELDTRNGLRAFHYAQIDVFCEKLKMHIGESFGDDTTRQVQTLCQIGCSRNLMNGMSNHDPVGLSSSSAKTFGLFISCLQVMKIPTDIVRLVLFKIWDDEEQLEMSEILGTMLGSGMIHHGNTNSVQPGGQKIVDKHNMPEKIETTLDQLAHEAPWIWEQLAESRLAAEARGREHQERQERQELPAVQDPGPDIGRLAKVQQAYGERMDGLSDRIGALTSHIQGRIEVLGEVSSGVEAREADVDTEYIKWKEASRFQKGYLEWMKSWDASDEGTTSH